IDPHWFLDSRFTNMRGDPANKPVGIPRTGKVLLLLRLDRRGVDKCRKEKPCSPEQPISPRAMCSWCCDSEPRSGCSPKATRSWRWQTQNADRTYPARDADWEAPQASRIEQVFQPEVRLEQCRRIDDLTLSAWKVVYSTLDI